MANQIDFSTRRVSVGSSDYLAVTIGGMGLGALLMGNALRLRASAPAVRLYGVLELIIGIAGIFLNASLQIVEKLDTWAYASMPNSISLIYIVGMIAVFGVPALCMGATFPLFGLMSEQFQQSIAKLYSLNTLGAAAGVLCVAFILIPLFGITETSWIIATINIVVAISAWLFVPNTKISITEEIESEALTSQAFFSKPMFIVFVTGFATFTLEIAWFRSFASVFPIQQMLLR